MGISGILTDESIWRHVPEKGQAGAQIDLVSKAGVGLGVVREMEQGKPVLQMDKVNQVLMLFGAELGVVLKVKNDE